jgi:hypothetical protein
MTRPAALAKDLTSSFVAWFSANKGAAPGLEVHEMLGRWLHAVYPNLAEARAAALCRRATLKSAIFPTDDGTWKLAGSNTEEVAVDFKALAKSLLRLPKGTLAKN